MILAIRIPPPPSLLTLDDLVLDKILSFLTDNDLRAFHQVSKVAKVVLELRPKQDKRRKDCVQKLRENKENERNNNNRGKRNSSSPLPPADDKQGGKKETEVKRMKECKDIPSLISLKAVENIMELEAKEATIKREMEDSFCIASPLNCSLCSACFTGEHPGTPCRIIDSESFSEESSDPDVSFPNSNKLKSSGASQEKRTRVTKAKASLKRSLRRIARL